MKKLLLLLLFLSLAIYSCTNPSDLDNGVELEESKLFYGNLENANWIFNMPMNGKNSIYYYKGGGVAKELLNSQKYIFAPVNNNKSVLYEFPEPDLVKPFLYDIGTKLTQTLQESRMAVCVSSNNEFYAVIKLDPEDNAYIDIVSFNDSENLKKITPENEGHIKRIIAISKDNKYIIYSEDNADFSISTMKYYDVAENKSGVIYEGDTETPNTSTLPMSIAWQDSKNIYFIWGKTTGDVKSIIKWNSETKVSEKKTLTGAIKNTAFHIDVNSEGKILIGTRDRGIYQYDWKSENLKPIVEPNNKFVRTYFPKWYISQNKFMMARLTSEAEFENTPNEVMETVIFEYVSYDLDTKKIKPILSDTVKNFNMKGIPYFWGHFPVKN